MSAPEKKDVNSPATTSFAWDAMIEKWLMIETLLAGTDSMREAGRVYLPQHEEETDTNYSERLERCTLFNMLELTLDSFVGKPFSDPVKLEDTVPPEIVELAETDIDLQGNDITVFCREWFREALAKGLAHALIDFPVMTEEEAEGRTRADDLEDGRRPYWQLIKPENLIFASAETVLTPEGTREVLTHVRIREFVTERIGFAEIVRERIRILEPGSFEVWQKIEKPKKKKDDWELIEAGMTGLPIIPLVTFYANRVTLMAGKPPLEDLALLNVRHWQSTSDQISVLTVARFPMLAVAGATDVSGSVMAIGPKQLLGTKDPNGRFYYVEHTGKSIEAGRQDLLDLEEMMASYGAEFLKRRPGNRTATARALDSAEAMSPLQDHTIRFIDAVDTAMQITAMWLGLDDGGTVEIAFDFGPEETQDLDLRTLNEARRNRDLSRKGYFSELARRGMFADDFDFVADLKELETEKTIDSPFATGANVGGKRETSSELGRPEGGDRASKKKGS